MRWIAPTRSRPDHRAPSRERISVAHGRGREGMPRAVRDAVAGDLVSGGHSGLSLVRA